MKSNSTSIEFITEEFNNVKIIFSVDGKEIFATAEQIAQAVSQNEDELYQTRKNVDHHIRQGINLGILENGIDPEDLGIGRLNQPINKTGPKPLYHNIRTIVHVLMSLRTSKTLKFYNWALSSVIEKLQNQQPLIRDEMLNYDTNKIRMPTYKYNHLNGVQKRVLEYSQKLCPNKGKPWSTEEDYRVVDMLNKGVSEIEIANVLDRTLRGVIERINKYKLRDLKIDQKRLDLWVEA
jgi:hypothetical protein